MYRVKRGQKLSDIALAFGLAPALLARENKLDREPREGEVLLLPPPSGNRYLVRGGESKSLLCGSPEAYLARNGTEAFYPGQQVYLPDAPNSRPPHTIQ